MALALECSEEGRAAEKLHQWLESIADRDARIERCAAVRLANIELDASGRLEVLKITHLAGAGGERERGCRALCVVQCRRIEAVIARRQREAISAVTADRPRVWLALFLHHHDRLRDDLTRAAPHTTVDRARVKVPARDFGGHDGCQIAAPSDLQPPLEGAAFARCERMPQEQIPRRGTDP